MAYRYKSALGVPYMRQGCIYFHARRYRELNEREREEIRQLCRKAGGPYWRALLCFVTTDVTATAVTLRYHVSRSTLYRLVQRYYRLANEKL